MANLEEHSYDQVSMVLDSTIKLENSNELKKACPKDDCSVDRSLSFSTRNKKGGWPPALLLLLNQGLGSLAFVGVEVNMVVFATRVLKQSNAEAANTFSTWMGTVHLFSLLGAFLSDAYLGRYMTCAIFQLTFSIGLVMLSVTTSSLLLKPHGCGKVGLVCNSHSPFEMAMFYISIYMVALGNGGYEPSLATFGSDQFDEENSCNQSFYSYFYVAANLGSLFSETVLAYVQNMGAWALGFWVSTGSAVVALLVFFSGSMRYKNFKPCGNPIARFCQVVVAAWRKSAIEIPPHGDGELYHEVHGRTAASLGGGRKILHTKGFRFLDHAAIITPDDKVEGGSHNPWRLCTITQIEEVKCILRLLPVWLCTIIFSGIFVQTASLFVEQGAAMNTAVNNFHIPPASMTIFDIVSVCSFIIFYDKLILPLYTKLISNTVLPTSPSDLKRMGLGLVVAIAAMLTAGFVEIQRRSNAVDGGDELSSLCLLWQIPQYVLLGVAEALVYVAQYDFFGSKAPHGLKSLGIGLCMASTSIGSYLCSLVLAVVMEITTKGGRPGWIPANLNEGHLERFFFLMAALMAVELAVYIWFAGRYKSESLEREEEE